jgi:hypothetical protein
VAAVVVENFEGNVDAAESPELSKEKSSTQRRQRLPQPRPVEEDADEWDDDEEELAAEEFEKGVVAQFFEIVGIAVFVVEKEDSFLSTVVAVVVEALVEDGVERLRWRWEAVVEDRFPPHFPPPKRRIRWRKRRKIRRPEYRRPRRWRKRRRRPEWLKELEEGWKSAEPRARLKEKEGRCRNEWMEDPVHSLWRNLELTLVRGELQSSGWPKLVPLELVQSSEVPVDVLLSGATKGCDGVNGDGGDECGEDGEGIGWSGFPPDEADGRGLENSLPVSVGVD